MILEEVQMKKHTMLSLSLSVVVFIIMLNPLSYHVIEADDCLFESFPSHNSFNNQNKINSIIESVSESLIKRYLNDLYNITVCYGDRMTGSEGSFHAAEFIHKSFSDMNNQSLSITSNSWVAFGDRWHPGIYADQNIIAELPGVHENGSVIVFFVHFDTVRNSLGADDDGSGVAALLAAAQILSQYRFNHTILFCASSGEEMGDLGDNHEASSFYESQNDIIAAITADAIGYNPDVDNKNQNSVVLYKPDRSQWIADEVLSVFQQYSDEIGLNKVRLGGFFGNSGNRAYDNYGFSTLKFFEGITNPGWENPPHTNDTIDFINFSYLTNVTKLIAASIAFIADLPPLSQHVSIASPREDALYVNGKLVSWFPLFKGKTICIGSNLVVKPVIQQNNFNSVEAVNFKVFTGENDIKSDVERIMVFNIMDDTVPFEYQITSRLSGWHTIRTTLMNGNQYENCDEVEVFFI